MRFARKLSLLAAFFLFISTTTAHAECAWVLWKGQYTRDGNANWYRQDAFNARLPCLRVLDRYQKDGGKALTSRMSETRLVVTVPGVEPIEYICFPDTVDPRK